MKPEAAILAEVESALDRGDTEDALASLMQGVGEFQTPTDGNSGFTAGFPRLDELCQRLGQSLLPGIALGAAPGGRDTPVDVYLASEIYAIGGHTALIGDYASHQPDRSGHLLVSNHLNHRNPAPPAAAVRTRLRPESIEVCPAADLADKLRWLMQRLAELRPDRLFLLNHPEDPIPVVAAQPPFARWIYFVHHADHSPALGVHLPCHGHLDVTPRAASCCREFLGVGRAVYVPLGCAEPVQPWPEKGGQCFQPVRTPPAADARARWVQAGAGAERRPPQAAAVLPSVPAPPANTQASRCPVAARVENPKVTAASPATPLTTASSGSMNKFSFNGPLAYPEVITTLLARTTVRHVHLGPLPREVAGQWPRHLAARGIDPARLVHVPRVESLWQAMLDFGVDLYLTSFPTPGARTSVEVMGSGTPMLLYRGPSNPLAPPMQLAYPEAAGWSTLDELVARVREADGPWLAAQQLWARRYFEQFHATAVIAPLFATDPIVGTPPPRLDQAAMAFQGSRVSVFRERWLGEAGEQVKR